MAKVTDSVAELRVRLDSLSGILTPCCGFITKILAVFREGARKAWNNHLPFWAGI